MDACRELATAFYARVDRDPVLRPMFPPTFKCPIDNLAAFLVQFLGGPCEYAQRRWSLSLREAHLRFTIGQRERDAWLKSMLAALDDLHTQEPIRRALRWYFEQSSAFLINDPNGSTGEANPSSGDDHGERRARSEGHIHQEIAQRWRVVRAMEEVVAAVRKGDVEHVLALTDGSLVQTCFRWDNAAFLNLLAIMSGSGHAALVEYVRQQLVGNPELVRQRYTYGRTLLHEVAAGGCPPIVELILQLGANPNAADRFGHVPLYEVGNASVTESGGKVVHALIRAGANVDAQDQVKRCTPLHMAARRGNVGVAEALLDCGANLEIRDSQGDTPLRRAVNCGKTEVVALLLARGADIHSQGNRGLTPAQVVRSATMKELLRAHSER